MAGTTAAKMCVFLATLVVLLSTLTEMASSMDLPYSDEETTPFGVMNRPGASPGVWQRRTVDVLLEALTLLRDQMDASVGDNVQQVVKKGFRFHGPSGGVAVSLYQTRCLVPDRLYHIRSKMITVSIYEDVVFIK